MKVLKKRELAALDKLFCWRNSLWGGLAESVALFSLYESYFLPPHFRIDFPCQTDFAGVAWEIVVGEIMLPCFRAVAETIVVAQLGEAFFVAGDWAGGRGGGNGGDGDDPPHIILHKHLFC
ncbi:MAG: hypothetical protein Q7S04_00075 [Candidatus Moranbacteria bacterium]|nr:hypothetical protein [Candidatus Moranbacteria bacterium]